MPLCNVFIFIENNKGIVKTKVLQKVETYNWRNIWILTIKIGRIFSRLFMSLSSHIMLFVEKQATIYSCLDFRLGHMTAWVISLYHEHNDCIIKVFIFQSSSYFREWQVNKILDWNYNWFLSFKPHTFRACSDEEK